MCFFKQVFNSDVNVEDLLFCNGQIEQIDEAEDGDDNNIHYILKAAHSALEDVFPNPGIRTARSAEIIYGLKIAMRQFPPSGTGYKVPFYWRNPLLQKQVLELVIDSSIFLMGSSVFLLALDRKST